MKLLIGFVVMLVALVAITGCTQTTLSTPTTTETTAVPTTEATTIATTVPTTEATTVAATTETLVANVTVPMTAETTSETTVVTTVIPTITSASQVTIIHFTSTGFSPVLDTVLPGTGINFLNDDNVTLAVKATGDSAGMFNSGDILPGARFQYAFSEKTGTYTYALASDKLVNGTIVVKKEGSSM
ncbi:MAG: hypothetical protein WC342_09445 [Methanoregula sp.]|jgi:plastocyanin